MGYYLILKMFRSTRQSVRKLVSSIKTLTG